MRKEETADSRLTVLREEVTQQDRAEDLREGDIIAGIILLSCSLLLLESIMRSLRHHEEKGHA